MSSPSVELGALRPDEDGQLFERFAEIVASREGYPHAPPLTRETFEETWVHHVSAVVAARVDDLLVGAYYLKPNFPGRAAHIANAGYFVDRAHRGRGIGLRLVEDSIELAPLLGFDAIQFNLVFESNPARSLYEGLGWEAVGTVPKAVEGEDAVIYWRSVGGDRP